MANVKLEWLQATYVESFNIYRSDSPMSIASMPAPLATGITNNYYFDTSITIDETYFYRVGAVRGDQEMISSEVEVLAGAPVINDPYWSDVELLIFADATTFPSTTFVDSSSKARTVDKDGTPTIVAPSVTAPKFDAGSIYLEGVTYPKDNVGVSTSLGIGTSDFTLECFVKIPTSPNYPFYARLFDLNSILVVTNGDTYTQMCLLIGGSLQTEFNVGVANGEWYHACLMRKSSILYFFINGVLKWSGANNYSLESSTFVGGGGVSNRSFNAYINSIRVTKVARYSETGFTVPDSKFPNS